MTAARLGQARPASKVWQPGPLWFGIRIWIAMVAALYVAFWLQLENASSAAVTVGILALPTRGQALQKAAYRLCATAIGVVASIVIVGLFAQSRDLYVLAFAAWLGACVLTAGFLDGNRAYGAVLSGYTVAVVAVQQMDQPQAVFVAGINRGASIVVGIAALALVNVVSAAPEVGDRLLAALAVARRNVRALAADAARAGSADPIRYGQLLREVTALRADSTALATETLAGRARAAAARSLMVALVAEVLSIRTATEGRLADRPPAASLEGDLFSDAAPDRHGPPAPQDQQGVLQALREHDASRAESRSLEAFRGLEASRAPADAYATPLYRPQQAAARNGLRAALATVIASIPFVLGGWPASSLGLSLVGVTVALSAINPNPAAFAAGALVAMPLASACAGITEFVVLDGADQFALLAIAMAPTVLAGALMITSRNPRVAGLGSLLLVFFPVLLGPSNPQPYDPQAYLFSTALSITAVVLLYVLLAILLPTDDGRKRRWIMGSMRREVRELMAGKRQVRRPDEAAFRDADRVGQLAALGAGEARHREDLHEAMILFDLAAAVRKVRAAIPSASAQAGVASLEAARAALDAGDAAAIREAAAAVWANARRGEAGGGAAVVLCAGLSRVADLVDRGQAAGIPLGVTR